MDIGKEMYVVRAGGKVIAARKSWNLALDSVSSYLNDLKKAGQHWKITKTQTNKDGAGKTKFGSFNYVLEGTKGGILSITINRGS